MTAAATARPRRLPYPVALALTVGALAIVLGGFLLIVVPQRFVLQAGLRESGITFPVRGHLFPAPAAVRVSPATRPAAARRSGPAEALWAAVLPLLQAGRIEAAVPHFEAYLAAHPDDVGVWREYAAALLAAGRPGDAAAALERVVARSADPTARLHLARLRRDAGDLERARALYRDLIALQPGDPAVRLELAVALAWSGQYDAAIAELEEAQRLAPRDEEIAQTLTRVSHWAGRDTPPAAPEHGAARSAAEAWLLDVAGARVALERHLALAPDPLDPALLVRLAQLNIWAGRTTEARPLLDRAVASDAPPPDAWRLLGDLHRWAGRRPAARRAYREALAAAPGDTAAQAGVRALDALAAATVAQRDPREATPGLDYFHDSDGFRRLDLGARLGTAFRAGAAAARVGYRGLEGIEASGATGAISGPYAQVELARWWRDATVRTAVVAGIEELSAVAPQPAVGASIELADAAGFALRAAYDHTPAHPTTMTLESALRALRLDRLSASLSRALSGAWSLWGSLEAAALSGDAATDDNRRWSVAAAARYRAGALVRGGVTTGALGYDAAAPRAGTRALYWDPQLSWSSALFVELGPEAGSGWGYRARVAPGVALVRERASSGSDLVPQLGAELGLTYRSDRVSLSAEAFHSRGREQGYRASGVRAGLAVRP